MTPTANSCPARLLTAESRRQSLTVVLAPNLLGLSPCGTAFLSTWVQSLPLERLSEQLQSVL
jgi:hypothetical protein